MAQAALDLTACFAYFATKCTFTIAIFFSFVRLLKSQKMSMQLCTVHAKESGCSAMNAISVSHVNAKRTILCDSIFCCCSSSSLFAFVFYSTCSRVKLINCSTEAKQKITCKYFFGHSKLPFVCFYSASSLIFRQLVSSSAYF